LKETEGLDFDVMLQIKDKEKERSGSSQDFRFQISNYSIALREYMRVICSSGMSGMSYWVMTKAFVQNLLLASFLPANVCA
jgi:hypothetical protein